MAVDAEELKPSTHALRRDTWTCTCAQAWPCEVRRTQLLDDYSGKLLTLRILMAEFFQECLMDDPPRDVELMRVQLLGWLPPRGVVAPADRERPDPTLMPAVAVRNMARGLRAPHLDVADGGRAGLGS